MGLTGLFLIHSPNSNAVASALAGSALAVK